MHSLLFHFLCKNANGNINANIYLPLAQLLFDYGVSLKVPEVAEVRIRIICCFLITILDNFQHMHQQATLF